MSSTIKAIADQVEFTVAWLAPWLTGEPILRLWFLQYYYKLFKDVSYCWNDEIMLSRNYSESPLLRYVDGDVIWKEAIIIQIYRFIKHFLGISTGTGKSSGRLSYSERFKLAVRWMRRFDWLFLNACVTYSQWAFLGY